MDLEHSNTRVRGLNKHKSRFIVCIVCGGLGKYCFEDELNRALYFMSVLYKYEVGHMSLKCKKPHQDENQMRHQMFEMILIARNHFPVTWKLSKSKPKISFD